MPATPILRALFEETVSKSGTPSGAVVPGGNGADTDGQEIGRAADICPHTPNHGMNCDLLEGSMSAASIHRLKPDRTAFVACRSNLDFMRPLTSGSMQLIVTSPPYNIGKRYEKRSSLETYVQAQAAVIAECVRLLDKRGSLCWQVGNHVQDGEIFPLDMVLYPIFREHGLKLRNRIIWHFEHGLHCSKRLSGRYETILWFTKGNDYTFNLDPIRVPSKYPGKKYFKGPKAGQLSCNPLGKNPGDVWIFPNVKNNHVEKTIHPCQFPVELVERLVLSLTISGDNVLDPYMGVGSSVIAALMHNRIGYGCDIVPRYVAIAQERVAALRAGTLKTRPRSKPVYDPAKPYGGHREFEVDTLKARAASNSGYSQTGLVAARRVGDQ